MRSLPRLLAVLAVITTAACGDDGGSTPTGFTDAVVISDFADKVVVPTYMLLQDRATALHNAAVSLRSFSTEPNLSAAQTAWIDMRSPWEQSEGFLFGPVSAAGYDPAMDSWPVDRTDLEAVIASSDPLTPEFIHNLPETQKGFHTVEYLLFGELRDRVVTDLSPRELEYLTGLTQELVDVTTLLENSWTTAPVGMQSYRDVFATAGQAGNTAYPSLESAAQEILGGMAGICDEVANGKIAGPYDAHDPNLVESQYSFLSQDDFANNMRSVLNAYTGDVQDAGTTGRGLDEVVKAIAPGLDQRIHNEISDAIRKINDIPPPFRTAITTPSSYPAIEAAQAAVLQVKATVEGDLTDKVLNGR